MDYYKIIEVRDFIEKNISIKPETGIILGSGLGPLADEIEPEIIFNYDEIPHFPSSTVIGHKGRLVFGQLEGRYVMAMQGRFHYYEGYDMKEVTFPVRVMQLLGIKNLIVTNAAGGLGEHLSVGDLMLITDHINFFGDNPLMGKNDDRLGERFPDMTYAYNPELREKARKVGEKLGISMPEGIYMGVAGPTYETPAEIKMAEALGADAVGMSTVPEVIVANHGGINVLGISCITNDAAGKAGKKLDHSEVMEVTEKISENFSNLVKEIVKEF
ncbi:purine-nucleoside phosphorylase [Natranaerofaba carboxydovora]|uniref:purine-nucleoside phosphorylase n=1 Tax=Natranaerofaba carboxydovora TaxID=2742683 RepID=UPI001F1396C8|nr:purine-nucleoside phosphorylase [Natranaerofaba carboxydovora]UMZ73924.1 Purine nucleoside phosphorylase 1 [Natranaerofaba carboxydovora]